MRKKSGTSRPVPFLQQVIRCLCEGQAGLTVGLENLFNRVDVRGTAEVDAQVVLHGSAHDGLGRSLHGIVQAGVDDVLLRSALKDRSTCTSDTSCYSKKLIRFMDAYRDSLLESLRRRDRDGTSNATEPPFQRLLNGFYRQKTKRPKLDWSVVALHDQ